MNIYILNKKGEKEERRMKKKEGRKKERRKNYLLVYLFINKYIRLLIYTFLYIKHRLT